LNDPVLKHSRIVFDVVGTAAAGSAESMGKPAPATIALAPATPKTPRTTGFFAFLTLFIIRPLAMGLHPINR
jgi:hypothetical protein